MINPENDLMELNRHPGSLLDTREHFKHISSATGGGHSLCLTMKALPGMILAAVLAFGCGSNDKAGDVLRQARAYAQAGQYEAALERHLWFHDNALQVDRSYYGVRLSFALDDWVELGKKYPKALEALKSIRGKKAALLVEGNPRLELFHDVEAINEHLGDTTSTAALFRQLEARDPVFARALYEVAEKSLIQAGEYSLASKYLGDPQARFATAKQNYERGLAFAAKRSQHGDMARKVTEDIFAERVVRLVTVLDKTGEGSQAQAIQREALQLFNSQAIKDALDH